MRPSHVILSLLVVVGASAMRKCGTKEAPAALKQAASLERSHARSIFNFGRTEQRSLLVDTYFHVVASDKTPEGGWLTDDRLKLQLDALNKNYKSTGVQFQLKNTTRTVNEAWANHLVMDPKDEDLVAEVTMKTTLRQGGYAALNIYFRQTEQGIGGVCNFPELLLSKDPENLTFWMDGCQIAHRTVPGNGPPGRYNLGGTATHEVGHWFGLLHTFDEGCDGGDFVDDTPAQATETEGCPVGKDTCTGDKYPGVDPIHNFMDYSDDTCMEGFTPGQAARIFKLWDRYRAGQK
ncbi:hypothetical protein H072_6517 [Dactylellina haptotyla CBS 200.50]|uniref:Peptidase M43 pregnancy-associated plasma-A domain-containing protein n=1 Tax=Dactylellina haptotyla (strain CBS 200.50) TaxID=1284197 RepID=S8AEV2_DACHA|nr:hypothetical protein H072_6517 [Dactylellina haptotyla CBS 200.50]